MAYSAVNTKLRGIYARYIKGNPQLQLLEKKDLAETVKTVEEWWDLDFGDTFNLYDINRQLEKKVFDFLKSLSYYLQGDTKTFYEALLARYEIRDIKRALRVLVHGEEIGPIRESLIALPTSYLESSDGNLTIDKFLQILETTDYGRQLITYVDQPKDRVLFYAEMTLDRAYYENIIKASEKLSKKDQNIVKETIGYYIDLLNLMYIYRGKNTYKILPQEMMNFLIEGGQSLSLLTLKKFIEESTAEEFLHKIRETKFGQLFPETRELGLIDIKIEQTVHTLNMKVFRESGMDIGKIITLAILLEFCVRDISTIIEARRLGFGPERTRTLLSVEEKEGVN